jgi:Na+/proline symporter
MSLRMPPMPSSAARFTELDWCVLAGYFVAITAFGLWVSRRIRSSGGYFLGDRQLPWWVMIGQSFGTGTNAENPVAQAGSAYQFGFATIWYQWKNMLITPFYWLMAPWYRRAEKTTIGEIVEERYGRGLALLYTVYAIAFFVFNQGAMLKGAGKAISVATGGEIISANGVVLAMTAAFLLYSFVGGLVASAYTDFVQGFLIIVLSFLLIPFGLAEGGGFVGIRATLAGDFPDFFDLYNAASRIDAFTIAMLSLNGLVGITAQPHILTMNATGRTERAGRVGQTYGSFVKRLCTIGWAWTGLIVAATVLQRGHLLKDPEAAFGYACLHLLGPGLLGLIVACVLAANMSTCSNFMVNTGALFTRNLYRAYLRPHAHDRELLWAGRLSGLALTVAGVLFGLYVNEVLQAFLFTETIAALMGIMVLGGFLWKRANRAGALAGTLVAFAVYYALGYLLTCRAGLAPASLGVAWDQLVAAWHDGRLAPFFASGHFQIVYQWSAMPFAWAMAAGAVAFVLGSLLSRPEDPERITRFFDNQARSTDGEGLPQGAPKPLAADCGQDLILLDLPGWLTRNRWRGFFRRYREDLVGFVLAWGSVGALVLLAWALMQIGR